MIVPLSIYHVATNYNNSESFQDENSNPNDNDINNIIFVIIVLLNLFISIFAAYLSFNCNSEKTFASFIWALIAYMLGIIYIIYYFFVNYLTNTCSILTK